MDSRIAPIENPKRWLALLGFWFIKRDVGQVTTVAKVIYARFPRIMLLVKKSRDYRNHLCSLSGEFSQSPGKASWHRL